MPVSCPSTYNSTFVTPTLSRALHVTDTFPDTVALLAGELMETVGGTVSAAALLTVTEPDQLDKYPAASLASALS